MPLLSHSRQPDSAFGWFGTQAGQGLLAVEGGAMARVLEIGPPLPWAWLGPRRLRRRSPAVGGC